MLKNINNISLSTFETFSPDGVRITCRVAGDATGNKPPLVLVHGTGNDHSMYLRPLDYLAPHFSLYMVNRRGRGQSGDGEDYSLEREIADITAVVEDVAAQTGGPVTLVGHSFGAVCCLETALRTDAINRLFLYEPPLPPGMSARRRAVLDDMYRRVAENDRDGVVMVQLCQWSGIREKSVLRLREDTEDWASRMATAHTIPRELEAIATYRFAPERFAAINVPTRFLLGGRSSEMLRTATLEKAHPAVAGSSVVEMATQAHAAVTVAPRLFANHLLEFCGA